MATPREIALPSGAVLKVAPAPFAASKALYQAVMLELRSIPFNGKEDRADLIKNFFCAGCASQAIEVCLAECLKRCTYNDAKIDNDTFEPTERRQDYLTVVLEVAKENIGPFVNSLYAEFQKLMAIVESIQK